MSEVDLDGVEPRIDGEAGRGGVCRHDVGDVVASGTPRVLARHRRQRFCLGGPSIGDWAGMRDLCADGRALRVDGIGQGAQPGDGLRAPPDHGALRAAAGGHR